MSNPSIPDRAAEIMATVKEVRTFIDIADSKDACDKIDEQMLMEDYLKVVEDVIYKINGLLRTQARRIDTQIKAKT